jgi:hypothetical protein
MEAAPPDRKPSLGKFGYVWLFSLIGLLFILHFAKLDDTTVLIPDRGDVLSNIFWAASLFGILSACIGVWQSTELTLPHRIIAALFSGLRARSYRF